MNFGGLALYLIMLVCELPGAVLRFLQVFLVGLVLGFALGGILHVPASSVTYWAFLLGFVWALLPLVWSVLMLVFPLSPGAVGKHGARDAVPEELERIRGALETFYYPVSLPGRWYIISDSTWFNGHVIGDKLFLTQATLQSRYLAPLLAHELGHLNMRDGRLLLAVQRLVDWPHWAFFVGLGGFITGRFWIKWAHDREFAVDDYGYRLGLQEETIAMIEEMVLPFEQSRPADMVAWLPFKRIDTHPTAMQRISRLRAKPPLERPTEGESQQLRTSWLDRPAPGWFTRSRFGRRYVAEVLKQRELGAKEYVASGLREAMREAREADQARETVPEPAQPADRPLSWRERLHEAAEQRRAEVAARREQPQALAGEVVPAAPEPAGLPRSIIDISDLRARYGWDDEQQREMERGIRARMQEVLPSMFPLAGESGQVVTQVGQQGARREPGTPTPGEEPLGSVIDLSDMRALYRWDDAQQAEIERGIRLSVEQTLERMSREGEGDELATGAAGV